MCQCLGGSTGGACPANQDLGVGGSCACGVGYVSHLQCNSQGTGSSCFCSNISTGGSCNANQDYIGGTCSCPSGQLSHQQCNSAGTGFYGCYCAGSSTVTCNPNQDYAGGSCVCGSGYVSHQTCNSAGTGFNGCYCYNVGTGSGTTFCTPNADYIGGSCSCTGGQVSHQTCNSAGNGYNGCFCSGSTVSTTSGVGGTLHVALDASLARFRTFCPNSANLTVVPWDNRACPIGRDDSGTVTIPGTSTACGNPTNRTYDRTVDFSSAWSGYVDVEVYCDTGTSWVRYNGFTVGQTARQSGFTVASVVRSTDASLANQIDNMASASTNHAVRLFVGFPR